MILWVSEIEANGKLSVCVFFLTRIPNENYFQLVVDCGQSRIITNNLIFAVETASDLEIMEYSRENGFNLNLLERKI